MKIIRSTPPRPQKIAQIDVLHLNHRVSHLLTTRLGTGIILYPTVYTQPHGIRTLFPCADSRPEINSLWKLSRAI